MFKFVAATFGYILNFIYNLVNNYGFAIIIFTILLKLVMLPISIKQQKTLKKTKKVQAQVKEIQDKYSNDSLRMNQELVDLYKRENMSPFSGCLTSIIQFVVILSIFYLVSSPLTYMKHMDSTKIAEYSKEILEQNENQRVNYVEIAIIKAKAAEDEDVKINMDFFGLDLSDVPTQDYSDPKVFIIPVLYVITSFVSMKINKSMTDISLGEKTKEDTKLNKNGEDEEINEEEAMAQMNKSMTMMMPIMTVSIACIAPLGLALYWLVSNLLNLLERFVLSKVLKEEEE